MLVQYQTEAQDTRVKNKKKKGFNGQTKKRERKVLLIGLFSFFFIKLQQLLEEDTKGRRVATGMV